MNHRSSFGPVVKTALAGESNGWGADRSGTDVDGVDRAHAGAWRGDAVAHERGHHTRAGHVAGQDGANAGERAGHRFDPVGSRNLPYELALSAGGDAIGGIGLAEAEDTGAGDRRPADGARAVSGGGEAVGGQRDVAQRRGDAGVDVHGEGDGAVEAGGRDRGAGPSRAGGQGEQRNSSAKRRGGEQGAKNGVT